jgi:hypothetical protein
MSIAMIGLDTAKSVFQVHAVDEAGTTEVRRKLRRSTAVRRLARPGAAAILDGRENPAWSDHQVRQPGAPQIAGPGRHLDGLSGCGVEQCRRGLDQGDLGAPPRQAGHGGAGEQDGAHRLGVDDAQGDLPSQSACHGRGASRGLTVPREMVESGRKPG